MAQRCSHGRQSLFTSEAEMKPDIVAHICNPRIWEIEAGLQVHGQPGVYSDIMSQTIKIQKWSSVSVILTLK